MGLGGSKKDYKTILRFPGGRTLHSLKHLGNKQMGHKDDRMARNVYRRVGPAEADRATQAFESVVSGGLRSS